MIISSTVPMLPRKYVAPMLNLKRIVSVSILSRSFGNTAAMYSNHYEVLGLTPNANQSAIKSAYYKLSMMHHPDKSNDAESAKKFRDITAAYEVLGNVNLKKMYDRGLLVGRNKQMKTDFEPEPEPTDPTLKFYKSRMTRTVTPTMDGRVPIYDFDSWAKNHYGDVLKRTRHDKKLAKEIWEKRNSVDNTSRQEFVIYLSFALVCTLLFMAIKGQENYDRVEDNTKK